MANNSKFSAKAVLEAGKAPLLIIGGMVAGNFAANMLNKVLKVDEEADGDMLKKAISPVILIGTGVAGAMLLKNENMKLVSAGVAGAGLVKGVKVFLKKDLFNLGTLDEDIINGLNEEVHLAIEPYRPDLPAIEGQQRAYVAVEDADTVEGLDAYQEVEFID